MRVIRLFGASVALDSTMRQRILIVVFFCASWPSAPAQSENHSSALLPQKYSDKYLIAAGSVSPNKKVAVIYPKFDLCVGEGDDVVKEWCKDYLVALQPFRILGALETKWPYFENKNHGGMSAVWSQDSSVVLVTLESKWGPGDIFLYELRDGRLVRSTNLLGEIRRLLEPDFRKSKADPYNDYVHFIFEQTSHIGKEEVPFCQVDGSSSVRVTATATTDPKNASIERVWEGRFEGVWDIAQGKFTSQKIKRLFAGERR
jgi:hypothetical protein